jgi:hypothetical protein
MTGQRSAMASQSVKRRDPRMWHESGASLLKYGLKRLPNPPKRAPSSVKQDAHRMPRIGYQAWSLESAELHRMEDARLLPGHLTEEKAGRSTNLRLMARSFACGARLSQDRPPKRDLSPQIMERWSNEHVQLDGRSRLTRIAPNAIRRPVLNGLPGRAIRPSKPVVFRTLDFASRRMIDPTVGAGCFRAFSSAYGLSPRVRLETQRIWLGPFRTPER